MDASRSTMFNPLVGDRDEVLVKRSGAGVELSVGGTQASWYQRGQILTGSVWDAIALPIAILEVPRPRVLILGLGGGTVARVIRAAAPGARIVGVDHAPHVIEAARGSMDLDELDVEVRVEDALAFLRRSGTYDMIVEDCFLGGEGGLAKPPWIPEPGFDLIRERLSAAGVMVCSAIHECRDIEASLRARYPSLVRITLFDCTNEVFVASRRALDARRLRAAARSSPVLRDALGNLTLRTLERAERAVPS